MVRSRSRAEERREHRRRQKQERLKAERQEYVCGVRAGWDAHDARGRELEEALQEWEVDDAAFAGDFASVDAALKALVAKSAKRDAPAPAGARKKSTQGQPAQAGQGGGARARKGVGGQHNPWTEALYIPGIRHVPEVDMRLAPYRLFDDCVEACLGTVMNVVEPLLGCLEEHGGVDAGFEKFIPTHEFAGLLSTRLYSRLSTAQITATLHEHVTESRSYLTFPEIASLVTDTIFAPHTRTQKVYACFLLLFTPETLRRYPDARPTTHATGVDDTAAPHNAPNRRRKGLVGFGGPELWTAKHLPKGVAVPPPPGGGGTPTSPGSCRDVLSEPPPGGDGAAVAHAQFVQRFLRQAAGAGMDFSSPMRLAPVEFARLMLVDAGLFALFFGGLFDATFWRFAQPEEEELA